MDSMDEGKYQIENTGPVQGQNIGDHLQVTQYFYGPGSTPSSGQPVPSPVPTDLDRQRMLKRVRSIWITGVLEPSLHGAALITLDLQSKPDALDNPWRLLVQEVDQPPQILPIGTRIRQVYNEADGNLLILGEPGVGKTTLLLELTRDLLEHAQMHEEELIPAVFNLSSWAKEQLSLDDWLVDELLVRYDVPRRLGQSWVANDRLILLLDGLDEVALEARQKCIEAINQHRRVHPRVPVVVCSRSTDYLEQRVQLRLHRAVIVQPLTAQQIDDYLGSMGEQTATLRVTVRNDPVLRELSTTPLMLSILTLAYQGVPPAEIVEGSSTEERQQRLFASYVQRMLKRRGASKRYQPEQITHWLTYLAQQMKRQNQTIFYIEQMQPDWLVGKPMLQRYEWWAVRLPYMLIGVLVSLAPYPLFFQTIWTPFLPEVILLGGLLGWLLGGGSVAQQSLAGNGGKARGVPWYWSLQQLGLAAILGSGVGLSFWKVYDDPLRGLAAGLSFGVCCLLLVLLLRKNNTLQAPAQRTLQRHPIRRKVVLNVLLVGLLAGLSNASGAGLHAELNIRVLDGLLFCLLGGLSGGLLSALLIGRHAAVQPADRLVWTWQSFGRSLFSKHHVRSALQITGIGLLLFSAVVWLARGTIAATLVLGLLFGSVFGLCYWLLLGFFRGVASTTINDQLRMIPNQGIHHSALNALRYGLVVALLVGLGGRLLSTSWLGGLIIGLSTGLLAGLFNGGLACLRHYILRILLWRSGAIPWDYPHFLDTVAERILLRKVGGGYIFLHRQLLDYLATLETSSARNELAG